MQKLPLEIQTLYAELMEQLVALGAQTSIGSVSSCFVTKFVKGESIPNKLITAQERCVSTHDKMGEDMLQAAQLLFEGLDRVQMLDILVIVVVIVINGG